VLYELMEEAGYTLGKAFDDDASTVEFKGVQVSRGLSEREARITLSDPTFVCLGTNEIRKRVVDSLDAPFMTAVHSTAHISPTAQLGEGTMVFHGSYVQAGAKIGRHGIINTAASVDHDCRLGDYVHVAPQVALCGLVEVGDGSEIGAGAVVLPSVKIGTNTRIGAGAIVLSDVPDNAIAVGNPARVIKIDGERLL